MLSSLFISQVVDEVRQLLERTGSQDRVVVCDQARFGNALAAGGVPVVQVAAKRRSLRRRSGARIYGSAASIPLADNSVSAVVGFGVGQLDDWTAQLSEWSRTIRPGGQVVMIDRSAAGELTRRALCGGLIDIEQRTASRYVITSGAVAKLP